ncbi:MAG: hypothetical protein M1834_004508 [Cirrosporium novae-zelandiae]|nr:MAG: hypothetical protein M1834_004508 [Cirrosporium novae-zelandiae]
MALRQVPFNSMLSTLLPRLTIASPAGRQPALFSSSLIQFSLPSLPISLLPAISLNVPSILAGLWESVLRAVPKKKTSHMKKRHRQMAGKALKDVTNLTRCPACGSMKRAHVLCEHCLAKIQKRWHEAEKEEV